MDYFFNFKYSILFCKSKNRFLKTGFQFFLPKKETYFQNWKPKPQFRVEKKYNRIDSQISIPSYH